MINDLYHNLKSTTVDCDACILGAGAAGITIALELESLGIKTVLLEGGGLDFPTTDEMDLYDAEVGDKPYPIASSRLRFLTREKLHDFQATLSPQ
ncbi:hypothetical protein OS175_05210 [Marinicella sp. S1101]|uniref:hypothetical protein n=1 Tax=Marinicella marina TaxID=2996016 RepID=UPI002260CAF6|nr:hypothetical protein [Marinicella marina]MCX7553267.1 hypothetical protein [Marinicella marina]MDJ1138999.1 hypothetical protein [Marinicella marina]